MKEKRRIWVVICGAFRLEIELYHVIALLCEWRSQGLLEGIVISTWKGEAEKLPGIRRKLEYLDIPLLESIPLNDSEGKYTNLNYARQAIQLNAALNCIPDDVFVLKCRTDFCIEQLNAIKSYLYKDMSVRSMGCFEVPIRYKIVVMMISVSLPFFINDIVFFGYKPDIRRMLVFENTFYGIGKVRPPEYCFFQSIFAGLYPVINDYIRIIDTYSVRNMVRDRLSAFSDESFYLPGILNKFYALYFSLLYCCFEVAKVTKITSESFYTVFAKKASSGLHVALDHPDTVRKLVLGEFTETTGFLKFEKEIRKVAECPDYAKSMFFTEEDYRETIEWGNLLGITAERWIKWKRLQPAAKSSTRFRDAVAVLFSDYTMDEEMPALMEKIVTEGHYYGSLTEHIERFDECDSAMSEKVLFTAARGQGGPVLERIGKMLYNGKVSATFLAEALMVFERYVGDVNFYRMPVLSSGKLIGLYYYEKYAEERRLGNPAQHSWRILRQEWELEKACKQEPKDYLQGWKELAEQKLESIYAEPAQSRLTCMLTEFLLEVCRDGKCPFSQRYMEYLRKNDKERYFTRIKEMGWFSENMSTSNK